MRRRNLDILSPPPTSYTSCDRKRDVLSSPVKTAPRMRGVHDLGVSPVRYSRQRSILSPPVRSIQLQRTPKRKRLRLAQKPKSPIKRAQYSLIATRFPVDHEDDTNFGADETYNGLSDDLFEVQQLDWATRNAALLNFKKDEVSLYWKAVEFTPFSVARLSSRCFVLRDWDTKRKTLIGQRGKYVHLFRTTEMNGSKVISCDCPDNMSMNCLHSLLIEQHESHIDDYNLPGEEPRAFLVNFSVKEDGCLFSVTSTDEGSMYQSHKRTFVTCNITTGWYCKSCRKAKASSSQVGDCYHVQSAKKELVWLSETLSSTGISVSSFNDPILFKRTLLTTLRTRQQVINHSAISYLPVAAPRWCRLRCDEIALSPPWQGKDSASDEDHDAANQQGKRIFKIDGTSRCSCGFKTDVYDEDTISINPYVVFDCNEGSQCLIETAYCSDCSNTRGRIGPDLGKHGVFNWNNEFGFTHDLLNSFTSQFSTSETTFKAFWRTTIHCYTQKLSEFSFCGYDSFKDAWFEFIQLQEIQHSMQCPHCGPNPSVVIADGISLGFASHRVESLRPPTYATQNYTVKIKAPKQSTVFRGPRKMLKQISNALKEKKVATRLERLSLVCDMLQEEPDRPDYSCFADCFTRYCTLMESETDQSYKHRYKQLLSQVFSYDSVCQLIPQNAIPHLLSYSVDGDVDERLGAFVPVLGMVFRSLPRGTTPADQSELRQLCRILADRARDTFNSFIKNREVAIEYNEDTTDAISDDWKVTGCFYGRPPVRRRPFYEGRDDKDSVPKPDGKGKEGCNKYYSAYRKATTLTGGLMVIWCPHLFCLGFHQMPRSEGRNDVFSPLYVYFDKAPDVVVYDFACQLSTYCLIREPEFFKDTCFAIDELHAKGHVKCSSASFMSNYMQTRGTYHNINTSAAECSNKGLNRIRKSVSYMNQKHAILFAYAYLSVWNRQRELYYEKQFLKELNKLSLVPLFDSDEDSDG